MVVKDIECVLTKYKKLLILNNFIYQIKKNLHIYISHSRWMQFYINLWPFAMRSTKQLKIRSQNKNINFP